MSLPLPLAPLHGGGNGSPMETVEQIHTPGRNHRTKEAQKEPTITAYNHFTRDGLAAKQLVEFAENNVHLPGR